jgi:hypothetical protein
MKPLANITNIVNAQYMKDATGKNQAIDYICEILQSHKDTVVELQRLPDADCEKCP